jgi:hypothetical protein
MVLVFHCKVGGGGGNGDSKGGGRRGGGGCGCHFLEGLGKNGTRLIHSGTVVRPNFLISPSKCDHVYHEIHQCCISPFSKKMYVLKYV